MQAHAAMSAPDRVRLLGLGALALGAFVIVTALGGFAAFSFVTSQLSRDGVSLPVGFTRFEPLRFMAQYKNPLLIGHLTYGTTAVAIGLVLLRRLSFGRLLLETFVWLSLVLVSAYAAWYGAQFRNLDVSASFAGAPPEFQAFGALLSAVTTAGSVVVPVVIAAVHLGVIAILRSKHVRAAFANSRP